MDEIKAEVSGKIRFSIGSFRVENKGNIDKNNRNPCFTGVSHFLDLGGIEPPRI